MILKNEVEGDLTEIKVARKNKRIELSIKWGSYGASASMSEEEARELQREISAVLESTASESDAVSPVRNLRKSK